MSARGDAIDNRMHLIINTINTNASTCSLLLLIQILVGYFVLTVSPGGIQQNKQQRVLFVTDCIWTTAVTFTFTIQSSALVTLHTTVSDLNQKKLDNLNLQHISFFYSCLLEISSWIQVLMLLALYIVRIAQHHTLMLAWMLKRRPDNGRMISRRWLRNSHAVSDRITGQCSPLGWQVVMRCQHWLAESLPAEMCRAGSCCPSCTRAQNAGNQIGIHANEVANFSKNLQAGSVPAKQTVSCVITAQQTTAYVGSSAVSVIKSSWHTPYSNKEVTVMAGPLCDCIPHCKLVDTN